MGIGQPQLGDGEGSRLQALPDDLATCPKTCVECLRWKIPEQILDLGFLPLSLCGARFYEMCSKGVRKNQFLVTEKADFPE